jgi:hypothetical protein
MQKSLNNYQFDQYLALQEVQLRLNYCVLVAYTNMFINSSIEYLAIESGWEKHVTY